MFFFRTFCSHLTYQVQAKVARVYMLTVLIYIDILFERSEFVIATSKKKKTDRLCVWMFD